MVDFNGDGRADVISGSYSPGYIYLFARKADGTFAAGQKIRDKDGRAIKVGRASAVYAADWDNDGDLDLVIGNISGEVYLVVNQGSAQKNRFGKPTKLQAGGKDIRAKLGDAGPVLADWDGDGLLDLLVGAGDGSVTWFRNQGTKTEPKLAEGQILIGQAKRSTDSPSISYRAKICVTDFNLDGKPDILLGDYTWVREKQPELTPEQKAEAEKVQKEYQAAVRDYMAAQKKTGMSELLRQYMQLRDAVADETAEQERKREARLEELMRQIRAIQENQLKEHVKRMRDLAAKLPRRGGKPHGFVRLYLRTSPAKPRPLAN